MKKTCNITKKAFSWAGLFVLALALVLTTFSSLFTSAKAFNEDDYDVIVEDNIDWENDEQPTARNSATLFSASESTDSTTDGATETEEESAYAFVGPIVNEAETNEIKFIFTIDETKISEGTEINVLIEVKNSDYVPPEGGYDPYPYAKYLEITNDTEWEEYEGKRGYAIVKKVDFPSSSYFMPYKYRATIEGESEKIETEATSMYTMWKSYFESGNPPSTVNLQEMYSYYRASFPARAETTMTAER